MTRLLPRWLDPAAGLAAAGYAALMQLRNRRYDAQGPRGRLPVPVVSVGNLSVGGVGKTPCVRWLAEALLERDVRPLIALRGYGAKRPEASDEAKEYAALLPGVPLVVDPKRYEAVRAFLEGEGADAVDVVLLDDGFQHRQLHRDLDLVLVDANDPPDADHVLPRGRLREPCSGLRRAGAILVTHAAEVDEDLTRRLGHLSGDVPIAWSRHAWSGLRRYDRDHTSGASCETTWLDGRRVLTVLGIGSPKRVVDELTRRGATIASSVPARDHERYDKKNAARLAGEASAQGVEAVVTTAKDWVKLGEVIDWSGWSVPVLVPELHLEVFAGAEALLATVLAAVSAGDR